MEKLKEFEDLEKPDPRNTRFHTFDGTLGKYRPLLLSDFYDTASRLRVNSGAPEDVQSQINIARNMWVYSWYHYPLNVEAGFLAFRALENALKYALSKKGTHCGLKKLVKLAIEKKMLKEDGFTREEVPEEVKQYFKAKFGNAYEEQPDTFMEDLPSIIADIRNSCAHGELTIHMYGARHIRLAIESINQLFPRSDSHD